MFKEELVERIGSGMTEALLRKCAENKLSIIDFLMDFIENYADDSFYDMMFELCDEYDLPAFDNDDQTE